MKQVLKSIFILLFLSINIIGYAEINDVKKYEANWNSLRQHNTPKWAIDAKFGIYAHWGPYSLTGGWTDNPNINWGNYYITSFKWIYGVKPSSLKKCFEKRYGKITDGFGYKDLCADFKATKFNPSAWADLIKLSGAKYAGICAIHHDGYAMWNSNITKDCAGKTGAHRDLFGEMMKEIKKRGIKTIATFHHARTYKLYNDCIQKFKKENIKGVDLLSSDYKDFYWFLGTLERFTKNRKALTYEVIDKYKPDMLWFDGGGGAFGTEEILAHYFNMGIKENKEVCVHNKGNFGTNFGIYSYENGVRRPGFVDWPWEDDTPSAVGWCDWPWWYGIKYKKPRDVVVRLADLVARNGGLLLSMNPRPDGSFDQGQIDLLTGIGQWLKQNGDAIYGTRPWVIYAEGHVAPVFWQDQSCPVVENPSYGKPARPIQPDTRKFDVSDIRFTAKDNMLYAIQLDIPNNGKTIIKSLGKNTKISDINKIEKIELLGYGSVRYKRYFDKLLIFLPKKLPNQWALSFRIHVCGKLKYRKLGGTNNVIPMQT